MDRYLLIFCCLLSLAVNAAGNLSVVGQFPGKVVVVLDGEQLIIPQGQTRKGVRYIESLGDDVKLHVNGKTDIYKMGSAISLNFDEKQVISKTIYANDRGMFKTVGSINGKTVAFLVDTGATTVAMSEAMAKQLAIPFQLEGEPAQASTASGVARAWMVKLKSVKVGTIEQRNVTALVIEGSHPREALLGMSFLNRLKVEKSGGVMTLETR